jgi:tripartite-type tricarboxylate transporter receptor subunit TctC
VLASFVAATLLAVVSDHAKAASSDAYPIKPVRIITPAQPGGTTDFLARLLAIHLTEAWKQQAIVDNRGSASGVNAAEITKHAAPDGYTLFLVYHQHTINAGLLPKLPYHPVDDFTPITQMTEAGTLLVTHAAHPAKNLKEFVEWTKTTKDLINFGSAGIGSGGHLAGELYKLMTGVKAQHIPYKGTGPALIDLMAGQYHFNFAGLTGSIPQVKAGKLRAIAVSAAKRLGSLPEVPAMSEALPGFVVVGWYGLMGPAKLPKVLVTKLHGETANLVRSPEFVKRMTALGSEIVGSDPEAFRKFMHDDMKKWADVVKRSGLKLN